MMQMVFVKIFLERVKIALGPKSISVPGKECLFQLFSTGAVRAGLETGNAWLRLAFRMKVSWFPTMVEKVSGRRGWFLSANVAPLDAAESLPQHLASLLPPSQGGKLKLVCFQNCFCKDHGKSSLCPNRADRGEVCARRMSVQAKHWLPSPRAEDALPVLRGWYCQPGD